MPIFTSESQGGSSVDQRDYYRERYDASQEDWQRRSFEMIIKFIDRLESDFPKTSIWLLTSHDRLVLMDSPKFDEGAWLVTLEKVLISEFHFRYRMIEHPIPNARVQFIARGLEEALARLRVAMCECGGWTDSGDLAC